MTGAHKIALFGGRLVWWMMAISTRMPAQELKRPPLVVPAEADSVAQFVPAGWRLEAGRVIESDLNGDGRPDAAFVISNGGSGVNGPDEPAVVKHVLVLALRGPDGRLYRSVVSDAVVLDGDEGGVFGDPFDDLSVDHGTVVISHYGGSRNRWGFTHRYRFQNGRWELIGLSTGNTDSLDPEHYDNQDINLSTGLVEASEKGGNEGEPKKPETSGSYYELEVLSVNKVPEMKVEAEWPGYSVHLNQKQQVLRGRNLWQGANDLSAKLRAVNKGDDLFLRAEVIDNQVTPGDTVRLVTKKGLAIKPKESKLLRTEKGYVFLGRYSLNEIARALKPADKYIVENLEMVLDPNSVYGDLQGFQLPVSVEVVDVDSPRSGVRGVLSTRLAASPYAGSMRLFRPGRLFLTTDTGQ